MSKCSTLTQGNTRSIGRHIWLSQRLKVFVSRSFLSKITTQWIQWNFKGATFDQSQRRNLWLVNSCDNSLTWIYTLSNILMPCEAQLLTRSQSWRHTYTLPGATLVTWIFSKYYNYSGCYEDIVRRKNWLSHGLTFYIHIYICSKRNFVIYIYICI